MRGDQATTPVPKQLKQPPTRNESRQNSSRVNVKPEVPATELRTASSSSSTCTRPTIKLVDSFPSLPFPSFPEKFFVLSSFPNLRTTFFSTITTLSTTTP